MRARAALASVAGLALLVGAPADAAAYCFTSACGNATAGTLCVPGLLEDCGEPLRWKSRCTGFAIQESGSRGVSANQAEDLARAAFDVWTGVTCEDGRSPGLVVQSLGQVACGALEYNASAGNANVIVFRDDGWPHRSASHNVALTTTTFDPDTGELFDADIELNSADFDLTTGDDAIAYDLESVLVHEAGHFLGIGHTDVPDATMLPAYAQGETSLRSLEPDDAAAICALYPPKGVDDSCNPLPRHGFSPDCKEDQVEGRCSVGVAPGARLPGPGGAWLLVVATFLARRRPASR